MPIARPANIGRPLAHPSSLLMDRLKRLAVPAYAEAPLKQLERSREPLEALKEVNDNLQANKPNCYMFRVSPISAACNPPFHAFLEHV